MGWFGPTGDCGCCGEVPCDCDECVEDVRGPCVCSSVDFGAETSVSDMDIDVTGTGYFAWSAGIPTIGITGTFVLACGTKQQYIETAYWKLDGGIHFFSYAILNFGWLGTNWTPPFGPSVSVVSVVETGTFTKGTSTNPYPTRTSVTPIGDPRSYLGGLVQNTAVKYQRYTPSTNLAYFCEHDSTCREECDPTTFLMNCPSGTLSPTETNINQSSVTITLTV